jgi:hypothetical protein
MKVNGKDDIPYIMENKIHVWNHQPVYIYHKQPQTIVVQVIQRYNFAILGAPPCSNPFDRFFSPVVATAMGWARTPTTSWLMVVISNKLYIYSTLYHFKYVF